MAEPMSLKELMTHDFVVLGEGDDDDSIRRELQPAGVPIAVMVDPAGQVCGVWGEQGRGTPIVASADTPVEDIAGSGFLLKELNREGAAVVVLEGDDPVGVVPAARFAEYLADERGLRVTSLGEMAAGDSGLAGGYRQSLLVIVCATCGARNQLRSFVEGTTLCTNPEPPPHVLVRR
jgi:hypothetical protein